MAMCRGMSYCIVFLFTFIYLFKTNPLNFYVEKYANSTAKIHVGLCHFNFDFMFILCYAEF